MITQTLLFNDYWIYLIQIDLYVVAWVSWILQHAIGIQILVDAITWIMWTIPRLIRTYLRVCITSLEQINELGLCLADQARDEHQYHRGGSGGTQHICFDALDRGHLLFET